MADLNREVLVNKYGKEHFINLDEMNFSRFEIRNIDSNTFNGLNKLEGLYLSINKLEEIDVRLFEGLSSLKELSLYNNRLKRIDYNTFKDLSKLERLDLYNNAIEEMDFRLFESLSSLKELTLFNNKLKRIDSKTFKNLTKLEELDLYNNEIEEIDVRLFENVSNLRELSLSNNQLKRVNSLTFKGLGKLEKLDLTYNRIEEIDVRLFESLSSLKRLNLSNNKLERIDSNTLKDLTKLEELDLCNNEIEEIDVKLFETLSNLEYLNLSNNKLTEIDRRCFEPLKSIEVIELFENVDLNAVSFIKQSTKCYYNKDNVRKYGSISEWSKFLQQFPQLDAKKNEEKESGAFDLWTTSKEFQYSYIGLFLNDRYKVKKKLGKGTFGLVYLVDDTKLDIRIVKEKAMKIMDQSDSVTENEIDLFIKINHDNIVRYFDHFHKRIGDEYKTFLITEYCENGDLRSKIEEAKRQKRNFDDRQLLDWMSQSANALKYLHSTKPDPIIHRDIKPANMLLSGRNEIKLGDLGISKIMEETHASTYAGTKEYMSPEVFKAQFMDINYYPNTDIWSLGCVLYELKFLTVAFPKGQRNEPPIPTNFSSSGIFSSVLPKMLERDCLVRVTSKQLLTELERFSID